MIYIHTTNDNYDFFLHDNYIYCRYSKEKSYNIKTKLTVICYLDLKNKVVHDSYTNDISENIHHIIKEKTIIREGNIFEIIELCVLNKILNM
jgi:hypothetical protein